MKSQFHMIFTFIAVLLAISPACSFLPSQPAEVPTNPIGASQNPQGNPAQQSSTSSDLITFVDENNLLAFDLPGNWYYEHNVGDVLYTDTFTSPDKVSADIESLVYNDGNAIYNTQTTVLALNLISTYYGYTGKESDIRIISNHFMQDGSERIEWTSKSGDYSGVSYNEIRGSDGKTFLLLTARWVNDADQEILDIINNAINSYYIP